MTWLSACAPKRRTAPLEQRRVSVTGRVKYGDVGARGRAAVVARPYCSIDQRDQQDRRAFGALRCGVHRARPAAPRSLPASNPRASTPTRRARLTHLLLGCCTAPLSTTVARPLRSSLGSSPSGTSSLPWSASWCPTTRAGAEARGASAPPPRHRGLNRDAISLQKRPRSDFPTATAMSLAGDLDAASAESTHRLVQLVAPDVPFRLPVQSVCADVEHAVRVQRPPDVWFAFRHLCVRNAQAFGRRAGAVRRRAGRGAQPRPAAESAFAWVAEGCPLTVGLLTELQGRLVAAPRRTSTPVGCAGSRSRSAGGALVHDSSGS